MLRYTRHTARCSFHSHPLLSLSIKTSTQPPFRPPKKSRKQVVCDSLNKQRGSTSQSFGNHNLLTEFHIRNLDPTVWRKNSIFSVPSLWKILPVLSKCLRKLNCSASICHQNVFVYKHSERYQVLTKKIDTIKETTLSISSPENMKFWRLSTMKRNPYRFWFIRLFSFLCFIHHHFVCSLLGANVRNTAVYFIRHACGLWEISPDHLPFTCIGKWLVVW